MKPNLTTKNTMVKYLFYGFIISTLITFTLLTIFFEPTHDWEQSEHARAKINIDISLAIFLNFILTISSFGIFFFKREKLKRRTFYIFIYLFGLPFTIIILGIFFNRKDHDDFISYSLTSIAYFIGHLIILYFLNKKTIENTKH